MGRMTDARKRAKSKESKEKADEPRYVAREEPLVFPEDPLPADKPVRIELPPSGLAADILAMAGAEAVSAALSGLKASELESAREVRRRKFGDRLPRSPAERARQVRFLQGRGFDLDVVMKVIKGGDDC